MENRKLLVVLICSLQYWSTAYSIFISYFFKPRWDTDNAKIKIQTSSKLSRYRYSMSVTYFYGSTQV